MEIHQLEYVLAVEKYLNFSLAADEICVSQPTLSHQIKKLEAELGVELFIRTTRSVQLTPAGQEFMLYAKRILSEIQKARNAMYEHTNLLKGNIKVGAISNITYMGIIPVIAAFQRTYPGINMQLYEANSDELLKKMNTYEIDAAFITYPYAPEFNFDFYPLINDKLVLFTYRTHHLVNRDIIQLSELAQEKFLIVKSSFGLRNLLIQACRDAGFEPNIIFESEHLETIKGLIEEEMGVALFSYRVAASLSTPSTAIVGIDTSVRRITGLAVSKNCLVSTKAFRDFVLKNTE